MPKLINAATFRAYLEGGLMFDFEIDYAASGFSTDEEVLNAGRSFLLDDVRTGTVVYSEPAGSRGFFTGGAVADIKGPLMLGPDARLIALSVIAKTMED